MPNPKKHTIQGTITNKAGSPLAGVTVQAFDKDPNSPDDLLGKTVKTDQRGHYKIFYTEKDFKRPVEKGGPDIVVKVFEDEAGKKLIGASKEPHWNAKQHTTINLTLNFGKEEERPGYSRQQLAEKYGQIIRLSTAKKRKLIEMDIDLNEANDAILDALVSDRILTKKEKDKLKLTIDLGRLTGRNFQLIKTLKTDRLHSVKELADWSREDWEKSLLDNQTPIPEKEDSVSTYADHLYQTVEKSFPSATLLSRLVKVNGRQQQNNLKAIELLHRQEKPLLKGRLANLSEIDWRAVSDASREKISTSLKQLASLANTYRHLGIREVINDPELDTTKKEDELKKRTAILQTFQKNNPELDLRKTDFLAKDNGLNWRGLQAPDQQRVRKQMMAYQRTLDLTQQDQQTNSKLLAAGYDSAMAIASIPEKQFREETQLDRKTARSLYRGAQKKAAKTVHFTETVRDIVNGDFRHTNVSNVRLTSNVLRDIDGYEALFGPQNYCGCEHCRSIFSPAAYFTDLMHFVETHVAKDVFIPGDHTPDRQEHPLYLKNRRPDLWTLPLTCKNTNTEIPYLEIVNEVLEQYLENELGISDAYSELGKAHASMSLPFNLPLEELRLFLGHFGLTLQEVYQKLNASREFQAREQLDISSDEELELISQRNKEKARQVFGKEKLKDFDVQRFLEYARISREELDDLLAVTSLPEIAKVKVKRIEASDDIQQYQEVLAGLDNNRIDLIHRFLRLWKKTPWSIREFDFILDTVGIDDLGAKDSKNRYRILELANWKVIQERLRLNVEELVALLSDKPIKPSKLNQRHIFERLFNLEELFGGTGQVTMSSDPVTDTVRPFLLAGLGISESALVALFTFLGRDPSSDQIVDLALLSQPYRQVRAARGLGMSVEDLIGACKLVLNGQPVQALDSLFDEPGKDSGAFDHFASPTVGEQLLLDKNDFETLFRFKEWVDASPLTIADVLFIVKGEESSKRHFENDLTVVTSPILKTKELNDPAYPTSIKTETEKIAILKNFLLETFHLTPLQLEEEFLPALTGFNLEDEEIIRALETTFIDGKPENPEELAGWLALIQAIERKVYLFRKLDMDAEGVSYLLGNKSLFGILDWKALRVSDVRNLCYYHSLINENKESSSKVREVLAGYDSASQKFSTESSAILASAWEQPVSQIHSLLEADGFFTPRVPVEALYTIQEVNKLACKLGVEGASLLKLTSTDYTQAKEVALAAFASKYQDEKERQEKLEPYYDQLRTLKRDALCDYIISQRDKFKFQDRSDLYQFFLLDVEMSGCFRTSRVVSAISSLQLYIHRCLLNLEQSDPAINPAFERVKVSPTLIPAAEWEWRKNYRVWEANRKVFLYPENYVDPALRENKTPLFKELEDELLQENITQNSAEAAYKKYMSQFVELANLRYAGAYYHDRDVEFVELEDDTASSNEQDKQFVLNPVLREEADCLYYFFARTNMEPYRYHYRTYNEKADYWGHWQKIDLAIEAEEVSPLIYRGKLYLFWTEVQQKELTRTEKGTSKSDGTIFKVYVKYAFLDEKGTWSSPQKTYIGYAHVLFDRDGYKRLGISPPKRQEEREKMHDRLFDRYVKTVFGKPYATLAPDPATPIQICFIWSAKECMRGYLFSSPTYYSAGDVELPQLTFLVGVDFRREVFEGEFPLVIPARFKYKRKATKGAIKIEKQGDVFPKDEEGRSVVNSSPKCSLVRFYESDGEPKEESLIGGGNNDQELFLKLEESNPISDYFTSYYHLSLSRNEITNASDFDVAETYDNIQPIQRSSLLHEYLLNKNKDGQYSHYTETGRKDFIVNNKGSLLIQDKEGNSQLSFLSQDLPKKLSTHLAKDLSDQLFTQGIKGFLSLRTQNLRNKTGQGLNFSGPYGQYYWELFFHIPYLIANHLNTNQKFKEAKWWYERIFNPTSAEPPTGSNYDHNWQFREFRNQDIEKLKEMLLDEDAIEAYRSDPFDPHAIATLRMNAYQKAIVMKYIDNLLDWGDHLFAQDTRESIHEAEMLYQLASDILGKKPAKMGACEMASENEVTYEQLGPEIEEESEFLITLENLYTSASARYAEDSGLLRQVQDQLYQVLEEKGIADKKTSLSLVSNLAYANGFEDFKRRITGNGDAAAVAEMEKLTNVYGKHPMVVDYFDSTKGDNRIEREVEMSPWKEDLEKLKKSAFWQEEKSNPHLGQVQQSLLAFCVPNNLNFLQYWDRVEDRLWKIRHCMNIKGVRRSLALFQPPIDPMLLVRMKAAGLSMEDVLEMLNKAPLPYRFNYLLEKARQFTQTVQGFGSALLSALEKKDAEELTLLRSVHEQNILKLSKEMKRKAVQEAGYHFQALEEGKVNVQSRIDYYQDLIDSALNGWERTQQLSQHSATLTRVDESLFYLESAILYLLGQWGSPFAITFGGEQLGANFASLAKWDAALAGVLESISRSAGLEASFQRREQEWNQQHTLAKQELKQVEKQILAAEIRKLITEKDLEIHETSIEQAKEVHDFYKGKFTKLSLYQYLANDLQRLYRTAYQLAHDMAMKAQLSYQFETDDDTIFIAADNWAMDKAGLLAGEKLLLQLQQIEQSYLEKNTRRLELTKHISLKQLSPLALIELKELGTCTFELPEWLFDLDFPGHYNRRIKNVSISIPAIAGPYTNVSCTLRLEHSDIRRVSLIPEGESYNSPQLLTKMESADSIATSSAQNDDGLFELNFRDERYLPFEGAGAISSWKMDMMTSKALRQFDYNTISDVILHISYTAKEDGNLREKAISYLEDVMDKATTNDVEPLHRLFSIRHEFTNEWHRFQQPGSDITNNILELPLTKEHFPFLARNKNITIDSIHLYGKMKDGTVGLTTLDRTNLNGVTELSKADKLENLWHWSKGSLELLVPNESQPLKLVMADEDGKMPRSKYFNDIFLLVNYRLEK